ncbi:hypothetical protein LSUE1_G005469 [Lachnellula suecica]|uniref:Protein F37C4.5 n=1 Tax=Lachnellula suecica TaxID=602035 RepID=A0A8T9C7Y0_9HELO|nr:hypothetical protein LSUE1_G005469 [Lachnellula suecica]
MATEDVHKQEFRIRQLTTRSVLLFPTRAQIIRDIKEITLHPGANQIVIEGLAPTVDEHSIKVEGTGSATITDVTVDLISNREVYEDIYPSDSEDESDEEEEDESGQPEAIKAIDDKVKKLNGDLVTEQEYINSATTRLSICDSFGMSVSKDRPPPNELENFLEAYNEERKKIYRDHESSTRAMETIREDIAKAQMERFKLVKEFAKGNAKKEKEKTKLRAKKLRKKDEIYKEKQRIRVQREAFWPKKVYKITINLEPSSFTPGSSRRSSIADSATVVNLATSEFHEPSDTPLKTGEINLSLSYITYSASWSPRYDLSLSTTKNAGLLEYGAELKNTTSETWRDAKVVLSTSQTTFSGLSETIPTLQPWHVRLLKTGFHGTDSGLMSQHEVEAKRKEWSNVVDQSQKPRGALFGRDNNGGFRAAKSMRTAQQASLFAAQAQQQRMPGTFGVAQANSGSSLFGAANSNAPPPPPPPAPNAFGALQVHSASTGGLFGSNATGSAFGNSAPQSYAPVQPEAARDRRARREDNIDYSDEEDVEDAYHGCGGSGPPDSENNAAPNSLEFEAGAWEESGMTTTYDVPGLKTLAPSDSTSKHKIAKIDFRNVVFSHIVIGKLRQVAFLKARLRNTSKITLLKGPLASHSTAPSSAKQPSPAVRPASLSLCPWESTLPSTSLRRSQTGIFTKEDSNVFTRSVVILNTKHNAQCELTILDQIPVSEDERLRIEITNPRGLKAGGENVNTGVSAFAGAPAAKGVRSSAYGGDGKTAGDGKWGSAVASVRKGAEVAWNVKLNPGQGVKLLLEYEATFPGGESVVAVAGQQRN